jgi:hypothetical protein
MRSVLTCVVVVVTTGVAGVATTDCVGALKVCAGTLLAAGGSADTARVAVCGGVGDGNWLIGTACFGPERHIPVSKE